MGKLHSLRNSEIWLKKGLQSGLVQIKVREQRTHKISFRYGNIMQNFLKFYCDAAGGTPIPQEKKSSKALDLRLDQMHATFRKRVV